MANGHEPIPQAIASPAAPAPAPSTLLHDAKPRAKSCVWCFWRSVKAALGWHGDWLFVSLDGPCPKCAAERAGTAENRSQAHDPDRDFNSIDATTAAFAAVTSPAGVTALLDHAKETYRQVLAMQGIVRDKAKFLLASTAFAIGLSALAALVLKDALPSISLAMSLLVFVPLVVTAFHFVRAFRYALLAITRESTSSISTQAVLAATSSPPGEYDHSSAERQLASQFRTAAAQTNQSLLHRQSQVLLAEKCLQWGLLLLPLLLAEYLIIWSVAGTSTAPRWADPIVAATETTRQTLGTLESSVTRIDSRVAAVDKLALDQRLKVAERLLANGASQAANLGEELRSLRTDVENIGEQNSSDHDATIAEVHEFADRVKRLEERLFAQSRLVQSLTNDAKFTNRTLRNNK